MFLLDSFVVSWRRGEFDFDSNLTFTNQILVISRPFSSISNLLMNLRTSPVHPQARAFCYDHFDMCQCRGQSRVHSQNAPKCECNWDDSRAKEEEIAFTSDEKLKFASNKYFNSGNDFMNLSLTQMHSHEITWVRQTTTVTVNRSIYKLTSDECSELWSSRTVVSPSSTFAFIVTGGGCRWDVKIPIRLDSSFQVKNKWILFIIETDETWNYFFCLLSFFTSLMLLLCFIHTRQHQLKIEQKKTTFVVCWPIFIIWDNIKNGSRNFFRRHKNSQIADVLWSRILTLIFAKWNDEKSKCVCNLLTMTLK